MIALKRPSSTCSSTTVSVRGFGQCSFLVPSVLKQSQVYNVRTNTSQPRPLGDGLSLTAPRYQPIVAFIVGLFYRRSPSDISRLVVPVDVDPVNTVTSGWSSTYISQKRLKTVAPFLAHGNAASTVVDPRRTAGLVASSFGGTPRPIFRCLTHPVRKFSGGCTFTIKAPATSGASVSQYGAGDPLHGSTVTTTQPSTASSGVFQSYKSAEPLTSKVD